jgi:protein TonB
MKKHGASMATVTTAHGLGPDPDRKAADSISLGKALAVALLLEAGGILLCMHLGTVIQARREPEPMVMKAVAPPPPEVKKIEPPPPPPKPQPKPTPVVVKNIVNKPVPTVHEAAPVKLTAPAPAPSAAPTPTSVSVPKDVGEQKQAQGNQAAPPTPAPTAIRKGVQRIGGDYPSYPKAARRLHAEGKVIAHVTVLPDGSVSEVSIVSAHPAGVFDAEVLRALKSWKFAPDPTGFIGEVEIGFSLEGGDD